MGVLLQMIPIGYMRAGYRLKIIDFRLTEVVETTHYFHIINGKNGKFIGAGYTRKIYHIRSPEVVEIGNDGFKKTSIN